jgi:hypothetical protein
VPWLKLVIKLAREGKLSHPKAGFDDVYSLPAGLKYLSTSGGVIVSGADSQTNKVNSQPLTVFFYTWCGILSNHYSGFEYTADGKPPWDANDAKEVKLLRKNWYWVAR